MQDFDASLDMLFAQFSDTIKKLESLLDLTLCYPVNAMTLVCKKLAMPKAAAMEAIEMFRMAVGEAPASAHDVYMAMQEILFILKTGHVSEAKLICTEESIARALTLRWSDYDLPGAVRY